MILKKKYIATLMAIYLSSAIDAQNLIPNGSFEEIEQCPTGSRQFYKAQHWQTANAGTPELFHDCGFSADVTPYEGEGMVGIILNSNFGERTLEYIQIKLKDSLRTNQKYCFSYQIRLSEESPIAINKIGVHFSKERLYSPNWGKFDKWPQVLNEEVLEEKENWVKVEAVFNSKGGEEYLTMGNFFHKYQIEEKRVEGDISNWMSYYYIDQLELYSVTSGCGYHQEIELPLASKEVKWEHVVYFNTDDYSIHEKELERLRGFINQLPERIFSPIKIEGHTDTDASLEYNLILSQNRAKEVEERMINAGYNNVYLSWSGEEEILNKEKNEVEKALNRRVQIQILSHE